MRKIYVNQTKETSLFVQAEVGFRKMGYEILPFKDHIGNIQKDDIVIGWISDSHKALNHLFIPIPEPIDYPEELNEYYGREIKTVKTINDIQIPCFVKPIKHKQFDGRVVREFKDLIGVVDTPMYYSEILDIESEYAVYIINGEIAGVKHYKGNPFLTLDKNTVLECIEKYKRSPASYRIDFGITKAFHETIVVEVNDGYTSGNYGLSDITYAKFLLARWEELLNIAELRGDHSSVAEELFSEVTPQEEKYLAVGESVAEGYFTLDEALEAYDVDKKEYLKSAKKNETQMER